jgi:tRNA pseudouridine55 synthase
MGNPCDGILLIDKNEGEASFEAVRKVRKILGTTKVGHAGTLDPFATGLVILLLGQGTRLFPYLMPQEKVYRATVRLGIETDTFDATGRVIRTMPLPDLDHAYIQEKARGFIGEIEQTPPIFSAVKHRGKRAYEYARRGIWIDLKKRRVNIRSLVVVCVDLPCVTMDVVCSSGTYLRSLAADLGRRLGTGGHLKVLRRLSIGRFRVSDALDLKHTENGSSFHRMKGRIISLRDSLGHMREIEVDAPMARKMRNGYQPSLWELDLSAGFRGGYAKVVQGDELVAIVKVKRPEEESGRAVKLMSVFGSSQ